MLRVIVTAAAFGAVCASAQAATVSLKSVDGRMVVNGEIISNDETTAKIKSEFGVIDVPSAQMECVAGDCQTGIGWANTTKHVTFAISDERHSTIIDRLSTSLNEDDDYAVTQVELLRGTEGLTISKLTTGSNVSIDFKGDRDTAHTYFDVVAPVNSGATAWNADAAPTAQLIGVDALSVIVHPAIEIDGLSMAQLARIYAGEITNWSELGGPDQAIVALKRDPGSTDLEAFEELVMTPFDKQVAPNVLAVPADEKIVDYVLTFPGGIGVVDADVAQADATVPMLSQCGPYLTANPFNVASGDYPLTRPLYAVHQGEANVLTTALFDSASQGNAQLDLTELGLNDGTVTRLSDAEKSLRLENLMSADLNDAQTDAAKELVEMMFVSSRLSTTFFAGEMTDGQAAWNRAQFLRLSALIDEGDYKNQELVFAGFTKSGGDLDAAQRAASQASDAFKTFLEQNGKAGEIKLAAHGFGAVGHTDCVQAAALTDSDHRVEVWIRRASNSSR